MLPTVAEIVDLESVRRGRPRQVGGGTLDRPVRWVHVSDVDDLTDLLTGGELVLTTGAALASSASASRRYLEMLSAAGVSGLIVELGTHVAGLPREACRVADRLDLPLVELARQTRFVEITEAVHRRIVQVQYEEVEFARRAHETFTALSVQRASLSEIVTTAADMLDASVVLEDLSRQVLAFHAVRATPAELLADWERRSRLVRAASGTTSGGPQEWVATTVGPIAQQWGRLLQPGQCALDGRTRMVLERAAQALTLHRMVERDQGNFEQQAQSGLIDDLVRGDIADEKDARARAAALGLRLTSAFVPLVIDARGPESSSDPVSRQRHTTRVLDATVHALRSGMQPALVSVRRDSQLSVIIAPRSATAVDTVLRTVSERIRTAVGRVQGVTVVAIGVGASSSQLIAAAAGLTEAAHVAAVVVASGDTSKHYHRAVDVRFRGLLSLIHTDARVQRFAEAELGPLLEHDLRHGTDLVDLLQRFLHLGGNKTQLARDLALSRPTLYGRLNTIERVLGVGLDSGESRTSLHAALLVREAQSSR